MKNPFDVFMRAAGIPRGVLLVALLPAAFSVSARADGPVSAPALEFASGLPGKQVRLTWAAQPGQRYRIEKSTSLGTWSQIALVEPSTANAVWLDPEPTTEKAFYRVMQPQAEVFSISLPVLSTVGGDLRIHGQMIPPGSFLVLQIPGQAPILVPLSSLGNGEWQALVSGTFDPGVEMLAISIVDSNGVPIVTLSEPIEITLTGLAADSPPSLPPAAPVSEGRRLATDNLGSSGNDGVRVSYLGSSGQDGQEPMKRGNWLSRMAGRGGGDCDDSDPFSPLGMAIKTKGTGASNNYTGDQSSALLIAFLSKKGYDYYQAQSSMNSASLMGFWLSKKGYEYYKAKSDLNAAGTHSNPFFNESQNAGEMPELSRGHKHPDLMKREMGPGAITPAPSGLPGEVSFQFCALSLETPAGPPLEMIHTYRSKGGHSGGTAAAHWECCYDISIEPIPLTAGSSATRIVVNDGGGRADVFYRQADGTYRCNGMFREGRFDGDTFTLTFADKGTWTFNPLSSASAAGKIAAIADVHQHSLTCAYDAAGQLETVSSAFGQRLILSRGSDGSLSSVADQTGRSVSYSYYGPQDPDGSPGDLKAISPPRLTLVPSVPSTVFTYSTGQRVPALNGNLLSITDNAGRLLEAFTYAGTGNPADIDFDTCASHNRYTGHVTLNRREIRPPGSSPASEYTVFEVDEIGRLTEIDFDRMHREVAVREFTGFCTPDVPVTSQSNRPTGKLHDSDPDYFETTCAYNADSRCTRITRPDGSQELTTYDRDFRKGCPARERGNARVMTLRAPGGEMRTVSCDYLPDFGTPECFMPGGPIKGLSVKCGRNPGGDAVARGHKGWDGSIKGNRKGWDGSVKGKLVDFLDMDSDDDGVALLKKEEGGRHTPFHNKYRPQFSSSAIGGITGGVIAGIVIAAKTGGEQCDQGGNDNDCDGFVGDRKGWDGTIKGNGRVTRMVSAYGQVSTFGYNANGDCTSATSPVPGRGSLWSYNSNGQLTSSTVLNGANPTFTEECDYDAATGFLSSVVSDPAGLHITTSFEHDNLGLVTRVVDPLGNDWLYQYNALDQCAQIQSPSMPNRISMNFTTDASGRVCRCDVEHRAPDGSLVSANPVYSTFFVRDERGNLVRVASEERPVNSPPAALAPATADLASYDVCDIIRDPAGQITRVSTPAACREQSSDLACDFTYNERGLLDRCIEGGLGTAGAVTTGYAYDSARAVVRCTTVLSGVPSPETLYAYDGFHRPSSITDPMGNVTQYAYGNDGSVTCSFYGEVNDVPGSTGNLLMSRSILKSFFQTGEVPTQDQFGSLIDRFGRPAINTAFFSVETEDETLTVERFSPGDTTAHATEVTVVDRSPAGLVQSVTCNGDLLLSCDYDSAGRRHRCADGTCSVDATLDACGNVVSSTRTDISGVNGVASKMFTTSNFRDPFGRVTSCTAGSGNVTSIAYDSLSRPVSITESGRPPLLFAYDGGTADATGDVRYSVQVSCDISSTGSPVVLSRCLVRSGEYRSTTDANGYSDVFTRDALGRTTRCDHPDGTYEETTFDSLGLPAVQRSRDGTFTACDFDLKGRPTSITMPGSLSVAPTSLAYDGLDRLVRCEQGASLVTFAFDSCGNPVSETTASGTIARSFNHRGRTGITYPDGRHFNESRNALGQLLSITNSTGGNVVTTGYAGHRAVRSTQGNGVVTTWTYRGDGDIAQGDFSFDVCVRSTVSSPSSVVLSDQRVFRDRSQQTTRCETRFAAGADAPYRSKAFTLDGLGRITGCVTERRETPGGPIAPESSVSYVLGAEGRRISELRNGVAGAYTQSALLPPGDFQMGQYTTWPGSALPLAWDDNGNLTRMTRGTNKLDFVHNDAGQLVAVNDTSGTSAVPVITYAYDALGRLASRTTQATPSFTTTFVYDGADCIQELGADGLADMTFVSSGGVKQCISTRNGTIYYPHGGAASAERGVCPGGMRLWPQPGYRVGLVTGNTGAPVERFDCDDACKPIFLTSDGLPSSATSSSIGLRWMAPECAWEPEIGIFACPGGIYSPDLGTGVSAGSTQSLTVNIGRIEFAK